MKKFIADKSFYKYIFAITGPIIIQNGITNFVSMLDNIMVGQVGTAQMSGVAIVNQLLFILNLLLFGGNAGAGIFTAQYHGSGDVEGVRNTTRFKIIISSVVTAICAVILYCFAKPLIMLFLNSDKETADIALALTSAKSYMNVMLIGLIPTAIVHVYSSTLRETGETIVPMKAGSIAVAINLILNYVLIFDHFGHKGLGVTGAAIATVIAKYIEASYIVLWTHRSTEKNLFATDLYKTFRIPRRLMSNIMRKGVIIMINEGLWSLGMTMLLQCYSMRGLGVVAAVNITNTIFNVFNIVYIALGDAVAIIVGQLLGSGNMEEAKDTDNKLLFFSTVLCVGIGLVIIILAPLFPMLYNTEKDVKDLATVLIQIMGAFMPMHALLHATYFTIRSGGKTFITFLFDSCFMWVISVPIAFMLSHYTSLPIIPLYLMPQLCDLIKTTIGIILIKKNVWLNNLVENT